MKKIGVKSDATMEKVAMVATDARLATSATKQLPANASTSLTNMLLWVLCLVSLAFSAYTSLGQTYLENRIRQLRLLNDRVAVLEAQIHSLPAAWWDRSGDDSIMATFKEPEELESVASVMRRLSAQVSSIPRLRRDVTQLKSRRQTNGDANGCMCPAGNNIKLNT